MLARKLSGAAAAGRAQPTFVSSSTASGTSTVTVTAPANIQNGDLLVGIASINTGGLTVTPPTGFNAQYYFNTGGVTTAISTKVASSESGNYTFTFSSSNVSLAAVLVYRNATCINTIGGITTASSTASISASSITPTYVGTLLGFFSIEEDSSVNSAPSGMTLRATATKSGGGAREFFVYDQENQAASATGTKSITFSSNSTLSATLFQVTNEKNVLPEFIASANTQSTTSNTTLTINKPTGTAEADLLVAVMSSDTSITWTGDTDWTEVADQGSNPSLRIAYKVAGSSEPSSYSFTLSSSSAAKSGAILTYRYAAYDTIAGSFTTGANPLVLSSISPSQSQSILLAVGARSSASITLGTPTSMTARVTDNNSNAPSYIVCDQPIAKGPTGTRSMSTGSTTNVAGIMIAIKPTRSL